ncbi:MmcQ/YjbR family DNA-binding protein [Kordiimonas marina]|uniref:MmcQ/YjbR family DNA-binding protein n=1 Tax=Kordiimonas marina TaxID=2872312 RepID=UPI001FF2993B|nr:MmcQ/YjbR family DNA-binding protein [Kordiimonas marina]MCJ9429689.1 MmcQ/YjbR family DNA-binding protein [Kordiimonas marina]
MTAPCDSALDVAAAFSAIRAYALSLPHAWEDFPWGEPVFKVGKKVFLFTGTDKAGRTGFTVKLPRSAEFALLHPFAEKAGYGLGRSGWVTCRFAAGERVPADMLCEWVAQSYRTVAPKKLAAQVPDPATEEDGYNCL